MPKGYREQYKRLTAQIEEIRSQKTDLLKEADLPLPGLGVEDDGNRSTTDRNGTICPARTAEGIHCHCAQAEPGMSGLCCWIAGADGSGYPA